MNNHSSPIDGPDQKKLSETTHAVRDSSAPSGCISRIITSTASLVDMELSSGRIFPALRALKKHCNEHNYQKGIGVYKDWFFAGNKPYVGDGALPGAESLMNDAFIDEILRHAQAQGGLRFSAMNEVHNAFQVLVEALLDSLHVSQESLCNLRLAKRMGKQIVILGNHMSHIDAPMYEHVFMKRLSFLDDYPKHVRFVCGAYMYASPQMRCYTPAFHTIFTIGKSDVSEFRKRCRNRSKLIDVLREAGNSITADPDELLVLFPYAGRAKPEDGERAYNLGIKEQMPKAIVSNFLIRPDCVFIPLALHGTREMMGDRHFSDVMQRMLGKVGVDPQSKVPSLRRSALCMEIGEPIDGADLCQISDHDVVLHRVSAQMERVCAKNYDTFSRVHSQNPWLRFSPLK